MNRFAILFAACFVFAIGWTNRQATAAVTVQSTGGSSISKQDVQTFGVQEDANKCTPPKDKPKKSKKNPNDGKDNDPDDGDAGKGNDHRIKPGDGPIEP